MNRSAKQIKIVVWVIKRKGTCKGTHSFLLAGPYISTLQNLSSSVGGSVILHFLISLYTKIHSLFLVNPSDLINHSSLLNYSRKLFWGSVLLCVLPFLLCCVCEACFVNFQIEYLTDQLTIVIVMLVSNDRGFCDSNLFILKNCI